MHSDYTFPLTLSYLHAISITLFLPDQYFPRLMVLIFDCFSLTRANKLGLLTGTCWVHSAYTTKGNNPNTLWICKKKTKP